jgi:hypothetical protein
LSPGASRSSGPFDQQQVLDAQFEEHAATVYQRGPTDPARPAVNADIVHTREASRVRRPATVAGTLYQATCGRFFAAIYESMLRGTEEAGFLRRRRKLLTPRAEHVEIGAGTA